MAYRSLGLAMAFATLGAEASYNTTTANPYQHLPQCKVTPFDSDWPSAADWTQLNSSLSGALLSTRPAASSCYSGNPFNSTESCSYVEDNWGYSYFHAEVPESIDYPIWANNSCLPPNATGYDASLGCHIGGYPQYSVNATAAEQVATALQWASDRNIRVTVKGTGHDLNGRSTGAYSLSIWTKHLDNLEINESWAVPGSNATAQVLIAGSGNNWNSAVLYALSKDHLVTSGVDSTVGLGGFIQGGGHGPLSSTYGLAADQLLQVTVATTSGAVLVANDAQNQDLFWALRGGGGGQYGVVTEYVMLAYPLPRTLASSSLLLSAANVSDTSEATVNATYTAFAQVMASFPDMMDQGVAGSGGAFAGTFAQEYLGLAGAPSGVVGSMSFWALNMTTETLSSVLAPMNASVYAALGDAAGLVSLSIAEPSASSNYTAFFEAMNSSPSSAGQISLSSSRLLGRSHLSDLPIEELASYVKQIRAVQTGGDGGTVTIGLQGGLGPRNVPPERRGALNPVWRDIYIHVLVGGANVDTETQTPGQALKAGGDWLEANKEAVWRQWAPDTGAYMNEANPFNSEWKDDFYGVNYDRLVGIKRQYDPNYALFVWTGVDSEYWDYDMDSGKLCQVA